MADSICQGVDRRNAQNRAIKQVAAGSPGEQAGLVEELSYRSQRMRHGTQQLDSYQPTASNGNIYVSFDVPGIDGSMEDGLAIDIKLEFVGAVINVRTKDILKKGTEMAMKGWWMRTQRTVRAIRTPSATTLSISSTRGGAWSG